MAMEELGRVLDVRNLSTREPAERLTAAVGSLVNGQLIKMVSSDPWSMIDVQVIVHNHPAVELVRQGAERDPQTGQTVYVHFVKRRD